MTLDQLRALALAATPGQYSQGTTFETPQTRGWSLKKWEENERIERTLIVSGATQRDNGRSRVHIARTERENDAAYIAALSPEVVLQLLDCIAAADAMRGPTSEGPYWRMADPYMDQVEAYDAARSRLTPEPPK